MGTLPFEDLPVSALSQLGEDVRFIDVREPDEFVGPLGHLERAELVPLGALPAAAADWPKDRPLLLICRSGNRSAKAALLLSRHGFSKLFNLAGGMLAVREQSPKGR